MPISEILWKRQYVDKLDEKHGVETSEVEFILNSNPTRRRISRGDVRGEDLFTALGQTESGRYLIIYYIRKGGGVLMPISARDMTESERKYYERQK